MNIFKSKEDKRIEFLLRQYFKVIKDGQPDDVARLMVIWEYKDYRGRRFFDELSEKQVDEQWLLIKERFAPSDIASYDIKKLVAFIVLMEDRSPEKLSVEKIRRGDYKLAKLHRRVDKAFCAIE